MRLQRNSFATYQEAYTARETFQSCGVCTHGLKIQQIDNEWWLICVKNSSHRSISDRSPHV